MNDTIDELIEQLYNLKTAVAEEADAQFDLETLKGELSWLTVKPSNRDISIQNQQDIRDMLVDYFKKNGIHYKEGAF